MMFDLERWLERKLCLSLLLLAFYNRTRLNAYFIYGWERPRPRLNPLQTHTKRARPLGYSPRRRKSARDASSFVYSRQQIYRVFVPSKAGFTRHAGSKFTSDPGEAASAGAKFGSQNQREASEDKQQSVHAPGGAVIPVGHEAGNGGVVPAGQQAAQATVPDSSPKLVDEGVPLTAPGGHQAARELPPGASSTVAEGALRPTGGRASLATSPNAVSNSASSTSGTSTGNSGPSGPRVADPNTDTTSAGTGSVRIRPDAAIQANPDTTRARTSGKEAPTGEAPRQAPTGQALAEGLPGETLNLVAAAWKQVAESREKGNPNPVSPESFNYFGDLLSGKGSPRHRVPTWGIAQPIGNDYRRLYIAYVSWRAMLRAMHAAYPVDNFVVALATANTTHEFRNQVRDRLLYALDKVPITLYPNASDNAYNVPCS